jgi:hypothetical protein
MTMMRSVILPGRYAMRRANQKDLAKLKSNLESA